MPITDYVLRRNIGRKEGLSGHSISGSDSTSFDFIDDIIYDSYY
jgi:hypothetical protein